MKKIDNLIAGLIGFALFGAFVIGLAETISTAPFIIIVAIVFCMAAYDFYQSCVKSDTDS